MLAELPANPKQHKQITNWNTLWAAPSPTNKQAYKMMAITSNLRLPILVIIQPVNGNEHIKPVGMANNTPPKPASDKCSDCCIPGIRDAQLAKQIPAIKNTAPTAMRSANRDVVTGCK